jgi:site-specific recombinase XerD
MGDRTFPDTYRDTRVKRPDFPLADAIGWFIADKAGDVEPTTLRTYRSHLNLFCSWLPEPERTMRSLEPETAERWLRLTANRNTRMNKTVALKSFAKYLARQRIWYAGPEDARVSVLRDVRQPQPSQKGTPGYRDEEIRTIIRSIPDTRTRLRTIAMIAVELHGFRAKEVRTMLLRNVVLPDRGELMGHFIVDVRKRTKSPSGVRVVPMEPAARDVIVRYLRHERPPYGGRDTDEPLFLTEDGSAFSEGGWQEMAKRLKVAAAKDGIVFRQHRFRSTRAQQLHAAGVPDSSIVEMLGWGVESGSRMLHRYVGRVPLSTLKSYPPILDRVIGTVA